MPGLLDQHYRLIVKALTEGRVVPLLGAGVNLCDRPDEGAWQPGRSLPSGGELATYLAEKFDYPPKEIMDLLRVSQYGSVMEGPAVLYERLRKLFDADYPSNSLHQLLATLPSALRNKGYIPRSDLQNYQLIVTTNYDDVLERSFEAAGEPFDLVSYIADGDKRGKFLHRPPGGEARVIEKTNEYMELSLDKRTSILKIHGAVDRVNSERDSYVITEDHYIDFLTHTDIANFMPVQLAAKLRKSHFLFLGYGLRDWNLRVMLHRIWGEQKVGFKPWAVQLNPDAVDCKFWQTRGVDIFDLRLEDYVAELAQRIESLPPAVKQT
jgi:hypothetical protein